MCEHMGGWRSDVNLEYHSLGAIYRGCFIIALFEAGFLRWPRAQCADGGRVHIDQFIHEAFKIDLILSKCLLCAW